MCRRDFRNITGRSMPALAGHWLRENFNVARWSVMKTLYNYVTLGLLGKIKSIDLPLRVKRKNARKRVRERKKKFGRSIDERDPSVDERQDFRHWECDLVLGSRSKDEVLLTLVERKTRCSLIRKLPNKGKCLCNSSLQKIEGWNVPRLFQPSVPQHYDRQWQ